MQGINMYNISIVSRQDPIFNHGAVYVNVKHLARCKGDTQNNLMQNKIFKWQESVMYF